MDCKVAEVSFEQAWRTHFPVLLRRARRLSGGQLDRAEELLAATALKALQFTRHRPHCLANPRAFLFLVLRHVFVDGLRRSVREGQVFDDSVDVHDGSVVAPSHVAPSAMQRLELEQQMHCVESVLRAMSPSQRRLFAFRFIDDLPYPQIAERLGVNQPLLRKRVQIIRDRLRREVGRAALPTSEWRRGSSFTDAGSYRCDKGDGRHRDLPTLSTQGNDHG